MYLRITLRGAYQDSGLRCMYRDLIYGFFAFIDIVIKLQEVTRWVAANTKLAIDYQFCTLSLCGMQCMDDLFSIGFEIAYVDIKLGESDLHDMI